MLPHLAVVLFAFGISYGHFLGNGLEYWYTTFSNRLEVFLENENSSIFSQCKDQLLRYLYGLRSGEEWAIRMLDAGAAFPPSGILEGNLVDLGSFDECLNIQQHNNTMQIFGKYCIGKISVRIHNARFPKFFALHPLYSHVQEPTTSNIIDIYLAQCFPKACSAVEMENIYNAVDSKLTLYEELCQTKATQPTLDDSSIATIIVFAVILGILIISTVYDVACKYTNKKPAHFVLLAFSVFTNGKKLINSQNGADEISCLFGIRVISLMWIILRHRYEIQMNFPVTNFPNYFDWLEDEKNMFIHSGNLAVDSFLLISGLLVAFNYMNATNKGIKFNIITHYVYRYLRLTPALAVLILFYITLLRHVGSGPLWPSSVQKSLIEGCEKSWWKTLLYIQNIDSRGEDRCINVAWYLSVDMQLFILSPFLLIPLKRWPKLTISLTGFLITCSIIACFSIAWFMKLYPFMELNTGAEHFVSFVWDYFLQTHTKAPPWLIGIILGYLICESKEKKPQFLKHTAAVWVLWIASLGILYTCVFAGHNLVIGEYNRLANSFHMALVKPVWAIAVAWIIFACINGYGGPVNWFLSLPIFRFISKLSYTLYLVHYTVIYVISAQLRTVPVSGNFQEMYKFWGDFAFSSVACLILTLTIEYPMITINKYLFGGKTRKINH